MTHPPGQREFSSSSLSFAFTTIRPSTSDLNKFPNKKRRLSKEQHAFALTSTTPLALTSPSMSSRAISSATQFVKTTNRSTTPDDEQHPWLIWVNDGSRARTTTTTTAQTVSQSTTTIPKPSMSGSTSQSSKIVNKKRSTWQPGAGFEMDFGQRSTLSQTASAPIVSATLQAAAPTSDKIKSNSSSSINVVRQDRRTKDRLPSSSQSTPPRSSVNPATCASGKTVKKTRIAQERVSSSTSEREQNGLASTPESCTPKHHRTKNRAFSIEQSATDQGRGQGQVIEDYDYTTPRPLERYACATSTAKSPSSPLRAEWSSRPDIHKPVKINDLDERLDTIVRRPRQRRRLTLAPISRQVQSQLDQHQSQGTFEHMNSKSQDSVLFKQEYIKYGHPTVAQCKGAAPEWRVKARLDQRRINTEQMIPNRPVNEQEPSWSSDQEAVQRMRRRMADREHFVANVWIKDLVPPEQTASKNEARQADATNSTAEQKPWLGVRRFKVCEVDTWILGKEFPVGSVSFVGTITGHEQKHDRVFYYIDDGTAVIECNYTLPQPKPNFRFAYEHKGASLEQTTSASSKLKIEESNPRKCRFETGTIVKVIGTLKQSSWAGRSVDCFKIEQVKHGFSDQASHLLQVAKLHREVYDQPFDLRAQLFDIHKQDKERRRAIATNAAMPSSTGADMRDHTDVFSSSSQVSCPGGVRRKVRFRRPNRLDIDDITFENFVAYVRQHLRNEFVNRVQDLAKDRSNDSDDEDSIDFRQEPIPFTVKDIQEDATLTNFATRLANKLERQRQFHKAKPRASPVECLLKQARGNNGNEQIRVWSTNRPVVDSEKQQAGILETKVVGSFGGSSLLLPTVSSQQEARIRAAREHLSCSGREQLKNPMTREMAVTISRRTKTFDDKPLLQGDRLTKAVSQLFQQAISEMWKRGDIVMHAKQVQVKRDPSATFELPDEPRKQAVAPLKPIEAKQSIDTSRDDELIEIVIEYYDQWSDTTRSKIAKMTRRQAREFQAKQDKDREQREREKTETTGQIEESQPLIQDAPSEQKTEDTLVEWACELQKDEFELVTTTTLGQRLLLILERHAQDYKLSNRPDYDHSGPLEHMSERRLRERLHRDEQWMNVARYSPIVRTTLDDMVDLGQIEAQYNTKLQPWPVGWKLVRESGGWT
ncbi:OB-fold domain-containing protein [Microbotryomycetes sp. JL221]|nr:OB-fold domain-containing protein [Microbotryomycetes sp. JL221]